MIHGHKKSCIASKNAWGYSDLTVLKWVHLSFLSPETELLTIKSNSTDSTVFSENHFYESACHSES